MIHFANKNQIGNFASLDIINRQQRMILYVITVFGVVGAAGGLIGLYGFKTIIFKHLLIGYELVLISSLCLFFAGKIKVRTALTVDLLYAAIETSCENLVVVDNTDTYSGFLILGNICLLLLILITSVLAYVPANAIVVSVLVVSVFVYSAIKDKHGALTELSVFYLLMIVSVSLICWYISRNLLALRTDNIDMREREVQLMSALGLDTSQILKIVQLTNEKAEADSEDKSTLYSFIDSINVETRHRMMTALKNYLVIKEAEKDNLKRVFPMLTPSELEIAKLIIEGKTTGDICRFLKKTKGNVGSQRAHIRAKIGLPEDANLKEALIEKVRRSKL